MDSNYTREEKNFLDELNRYLPKNIDWKEGAKTYLSALLRIDPSAERYHLTKPFIGGPDFSSFFEEMNKFINVLQKLNLPMKSHILDVGTGPGWTSYFLGKLGHRVLGIDISQELLDLAKKRIQSDPFPPYREIPFTVNFKLHDIEKDPLVTEEFFDVAICESTLHHFLDPISALRNIGGSLKPSGVIVILEGIAPERGSCWDKKYEELMVEYKTLERPYTREQMAKLLTLTGFRFYSFYSGVNGFFEQNKAGISEMRNMFDFGKNYNYVFASRDEETLRGINSPKSGIVDLDDYSELEETVFLKILKKLYQAVPKKLIYRKKIAKNADFLKKQYADIFRREPDKEGFEYFLSKLNGNELSREDVVNIFKNSEEFKRLGKK
jgi:SAM-dependent methyltransferase